MIPFNDMDAGEREVLIREVRQAALESVSRRYVLMAAADELERRTGGSFWGVVLAGVFACVVLVIAATRCGAAEVSHYDLNPSGPLVSVSGVRADTLIVEFTLGDFKATGGGHLVFGRGDLQRHFNNPALGPVGEGLVIGEASVCNAGAGVVSAVMESWWQGGNALHPETCVNGLAPGVRYSATVTAGGYTLSNGAGGRVLYPKTVSPPLGYFVFGVSSPTPYVLHSVRVLSGPVREELK